MAKARSTLKQLLVPDRLQAGLYFVMGLILLVVFSAPALWESFKANALGGAEAQVWGSDAVTHQIQRFWERFGASRGLQITVWILAGAALYLIIWFLRNLVVNIKNDFIARGFVGAGAGRGYWRSVLGLKIFFGLSLVVTIIYLIFGLRLMHLLSQQFYIAITELKLWPSPAELVWLMAASSFLLYVFAVLLHLVASSSRAIYKGL